MATEIEGSAREAYADEVLSVDNLSFAYEAKKPVVRNVTFEVSSGMCLGLLGRNGAGKSTLLGAITQTISGIMSGQVQPAAASQRRRSMGYASQGIGLQRYLTVAENLRHYASLHLGTTKVDDLVEECVTEFALESTAGTRAGRLSGGQARIAHIASSFVHRPVIRILDEPTAALDIDARNHLVELIASWTARGDICVVTSHYPEDIETMCTHLTVLVDGVSHFIGKVEDVLHGQAVHGEIHGRRADSAGDELFVLDEPVSSLCGLVDQVSRLGFAADDRLLSVRVGRVTLRSILESSDALRAAVSNERVEESR